VVLFYGRFRLIRGGGGFVVIIIGGPAVVVFVVVGYEGTEFGSVNGECHTILFEIFDKFLVQILDNNRTDCDIFVFVRISSTFIVVVMEVSKDGVP